MTTEQHETVTPPAVHTPTPIRRLTRSRDDRMLGGVCGGLADYLAVDVTVVRLLTVAGTILGFGSLLLVYVVAWVVVPRE